MPVDARNETEAELGCGLTSFGGQGLMMSFAGLSVAGAGESALGARECAGGSGRTAVWPSKPPGQRPPPTITTSRGSG